MPERGPVMDVASFDEIEQEFMERVRGIVWCSVATVDRRGRPRSRILTPHLRRGDWLDRHRAAFVQGEASGSQPAPSRLRTRTPNTSRYMQRAWHNGKTARQ